MCGLLAIAVVLCSDRLHVYNLVLWLLSAAFVFDFLDGFMARRLAVETLVGKDLDSLADIVSFGLAPSVLSICFLLTIAGGTAWHYIAYLGVFLLPVCTALRLAKFNNDVRQKVDFVGLPASVSGLILTSFICFLASIAGSESALYYNISFWSFLLIMVFVLLNSWLMNSNIIFFSFKDTSKLLRGWTKQRIMLAVADIVIVAFLLTSLPFHLGLLCIFIVYMLMNVLIHFFARG